MKSVQSLIKAKTTSLLFVRGERKVYSVVPNAEFKREFFKFGRGWAFPINDSFEFMEKARLTGNQYDSGYVLVDKRKG